MRAHIVGVLLADSNVVAVGLPDVDKVKQTTTYTDTTIQETTRDMPVGEVVDRAEPGVDVAPMVRPFLVRSTPGWPLPAVVHGVDVLQSLFFSSV